MKTRKTDNRHAFITLTPTAGLRFKLFTFFGRLNRPARWFSFFFVLFFYSGCDYSQHYSRDTFNYLRTGCVAILPFNNCSNNPFASKIMTDLFATELYAEKKILLVSPHSITEIFGEDLEAGTDALIQKYGIQEIAERLEADSLIIGTVTRFDTKKEVKETPVVGIDVKLVIAESGDTIWAYSYTREDISIAFFQATLDTTARKAGRHVAHELSRLIPELPQ